MRRITLAVWPILGLLSSSGIGQKAMRSPEFGKVEAFSYVSQPRPNHGVATALLDEKLVRRAEARWLQVEFGDRRLSAGSWIEVLSLLDHEVEILDAETLARQGGFSLYFNGEALRIRLYGGPGTTGQFFSIQSLGVGYSRAQLMPMSLCGTDSRYRVSDPRIARLIVRRGTGYTWCTAFLISSTNCFATSGNCMAMPGTTSLVAQFNVPSSTASGALVFPSTSHQYVWMGSGTSVAEWQNAGVGNDWGVFKTNVNSGTGKHAGAVQGSYVRFQGTPAASTSARLTGYGMDDTPRSYSGTQQSSLGPHHSTVGTRINFTVDTMMGCSGAPVEQSSTARAYGVNTHEYCSSSGGFNSGTAGTHPGFSAARTRLAADPRTDLAVSYVWASSTALAPNQVISVRAWIRNMTGNAAQASSAGYYLSRDSAITTADLYLGSFSVPILGGWSTHTDSQSIRLPGSLPVGNCYLGVIADRLNQVPETNETNNTRYIPVTCTGSSLPDLQIYSLYTTSALVSGGDIRVTTTTVNRGNTPAAASYTALFLSRDKNITTADYFLGSNWNPALGSNLSRTLTFTYDVPIGVTPGTWYLGAMADYDSRIKESIETNNTRSMVMSASEMSAAKKRVEFLPYLGTMALTEVLSTGSASQGGVARMCVAAPALPRHYYLCVWSGSPTGAVDAYTSFSLSLMNTHVFQAWLGVLDGSGRSYPSFNLPRVSGLSPFDVYTKALFLAPTSFALAGSSDNVIRTHIGR